jgi:hypothetical protein
LLIKTLIFLLNYSAIFGIALGFLTSAAAAQDSNNSDVIIGTVRTTFTF